MSPTLSTADPDAAAVAAGLTPADEGHLAEALALAMSADATIAPDPYVGCVIVAPDGSVVGRGVHGTHGGPHAEPQALAAAGEQARDATLYCTLEPCGYDAPVKRHPPCTRAIIGAGVSRVVVGMVDPHPRVRGSGIDVLRAAGIRVQLSADQRPYRRLNAAYVAQHR
jgi:diaminohydroxyphosphoribosylaminopyrimidine deaminase/5-amino-6-(5-phosphoribosylamino)uracil reductase